jgi:hypothetical protein
MVAQSSFAQDSRQTAPFTTPIRYDLSPVGNQVPLIGAAQAKEDALHKKISLHQQEHGTRFKDFHQDVFFGNSVDFPCSDQQFF